MPLVTRRRDALTDDLLSDMMRAEVDGDRLSHDELLMLAATLLMAGTDTTRNQLAAAVQVFATIRTVGAAGRTTGARSSSGARGDALLAGRLDDDAHRCRRR